MADISKLSRLVNGVHRDVDLSQNTLVVGSLKIGSTAPVEITKAIATKLIQIQSVADADGTFDTRYHTKTALAANGGAALIGSSTGDTVEQRLLDIEGSMGSGSAAGITFDPAGTSLTATNVQDMGEELDSRVQATEAVANAAIPLAQKGANNGVATLDSGGKIPAAQLPNSVMELQGFWNAATNTPTLANGSGNPGDVYEVTTAGDVDFGDGNTIVFAVGDWAVYAADGKWHKSTNSNEVTLVNGQKGIVVLDTDDIDEGARQYFTEERAQDAVGNIFAESDTIALNYNDGAPEISADVKDNSIGISKLTEDVADQETMTGGNGVPLSVLVSPMVRKVMILGESVAEDETFVVRMAVSGETAGRVYKADYDATTLNNFFAIGLARSVTGASSGDQVPVTLMGSHDLGANDTPFASGDIGKPVYLTAAGAFSTTPPTADNQAVMKVGMVETTTKILMVGMQLHGIN